MGDMADRAMRQELERVNTALREENDRLKAAVEEIRREESYWRYTVVALKLCPVHDNTYISHDCVEEILNEQAILTRAVEQAEDEATFLRGQYNEAEEKRSKAERERDKARDEIDKVLADAIYQREEKEKAEAEVERLEGFADRKARFALVIKGGSHDVGQNAGEKTVS